MSETSRHGGRPGRTFWLNKRQCLYLCTKSETERATEATIQMVEVFDEHLRCSLPAPKPVAVKEHRRALPKPPRVEAPEPLALPKPAEAIAGPFEPGSNLLMDLWCSVHSAKIRMEARPEEDFSSSLMGVLGDQLRIRDGLKPSGKTFDWNWKRVEASKLRRGGPAEPVDPPGASCRH